MDFSHPINTNDHGLGPMIIALTWLFTSLAIIIVTARFYIRKRVSQRLYSSDWIMLPALVFQIAYSGLITKACKEGLGMTYDNMTLEQFQGALKWTFISQPFSHTVSILARISITVSLVSIFGESKPWFRWFGIVYTFNLSAFGIMSIVLPLFGIRPIAGNWDPTIQVTHIIEPNVQEHIAEVLQCKLW